MMSPVINECYYLQTLVDSLSREQMYIGPETDCDVPSKPLIPNARRNIREFLTHPDIQIRQYATSSGGARVHKLFRAEDGTIYRVYIAYRCVRVYYLTRYLLSDIFEEDDMPEFEDPVFLTEPIVENQNIESQVSPSNDNINTINMIDTEVADIIPRPLSIENLPPRYERELMSWLTDQQRLEINHLEKLSQNLYAEQMYIPTGMVCAEISHHYFENARRIIREFMDNPELRVVVYGYSSGGARIHKLFRASNGDIFQVYVDVDRGPRIYFLTDYLVEYIYADSNCEIPASIEMLWEWHSGKV
jgi:hypothetical protein